MQRGEWEEGGRKKRERKKERGTPVMTDTC
jgi:hypothetical protein